MSVLVDTSVWVEYFRNGNCSEKLEYLVDENLVKINDLILAELVPFLKIRNQKKVISLLNKINRNNIQIDWEQLIEYQYKCLKNGINGIGIPDLIIAQNAKQNRSSIYSIDNHFTQLSKILNIDLYS